MRIKHNPPVFVELLNEVIEEEEKFDIFAFEAIDEE